MPFPIVKHVFPAFALAVVLGNAATSGQLTDRFVLIRNRMVDTEIVAAGIKNQRVIQAMRVTPRHQFVSFQQLREAYFDMALPIGGGQTISPPFVVAYMTEKLDPQPTDKVLEIGTGSGYQAAVLSNLVDQVFSIEIVEVLGRRTAALLRRLGYKNIHTKIGDGYQGWPEHAPFDKIIVTCSPENVPQPLVDQLAEGGRLVVPLGERYQQSLYLFQKVNGRLQRETLEATFFVPMTGQAEKQRQVFPEMASPQLVDGSFEETTDTGNAPVGWFYVRQCTVEESKDAPAGKSYVTFSNTMPGRNAQAMQAFGIDGRRTRGLDVSFWIRGQGIRPGPTPNQQAKVLVEFYGENRDAVTHNVLGPWFGSFDWKREDRKLAVPPRARLAVIAIGLFGATGDISFDDVHIEVPRR